MDRVVRLWRVGGHNETADMLVQEVLSQKHALRRAGAHAGLTGSPTRRKKTPGKGWPVPATPGSAGMIQLAWRFSCSRGQHRRVVSITENPRLANMIVALARSY